MTAVKDENTKGTIIFFDGVCHLCNGFVDFLILHDPQHRLSFAPLQGETAKALLPAATLARLERVVFYRHGKTCEGSEAVLRALVQLGSFYRLAGVLLVIPSFLREGIYAWIAKNRYNWFGERDFCRLPQAHEKEYLLP